MLAKNLVIELAQYNINVNAVAPGFISSDMTADLNETELSNLWPMEFITDWHLFYRSEADMLAWTEGMASHRAWTETDPTGRVRLLFVRKDA